MNVLGLHLLLELKECNPALLDDLEYIREALLQTAQKLGAHVVGESFHRFAPQGVTGILSIAAAKLGAARVLAVDTDPQAVSATRANVAANGIEAVEVREGTLDLGGTSDERFDIVVANISGLAIERLAPAIAGVLKPRGRLMASGFLDDAVGTIRTAFDAVDLAVERVVEDGVWRSILARRGDA